MDLVVEFLKKIDLISKYFPKDEQGLRYLMDAKNDEKKILKDVIEKDREDPNFLFFILIKSLINHFPQGTQYFIDNFDFFSKRIKEILVYFSRKK